MARRGPRSTLYRQEIGWTLLKLQPTGRSGVTITRAGSTSYSSEIAEINAGCPLEGSICEHHCPKSLWLIDGQTPVVIDMYPQYVKGTWRFPSSQVILHTLKNGLLDIVFQSRWFG